MMLEKWLQAALKSAKISQSALSRMLTEELGRSIDRAAVNKMVKGTRSIAADELLVISTITKQPIPSEAPTVPLFGKVGAGQAIYPFDDDSPVDYVDAWSSAAPTNTVAVEVDGESMLPAYESGDLIYYSTHKLPHEMINRRCVAKLADGRLLVKILRRGSDDGLWTLQSINATTADIEDIVVEWVAKIDCVIPR